MTTLTPDHGKRGNSEHVEGTLGKKGKVQTSLLSHFAKVKPKAEPEINSSPIKVGATSEPNTLSNNLYATVDGDSSEKIDKEMDRDSFVQKLTPEQQALLSLELSQLPPDWLKHLYQELTKPYFLRLKEFLLGEKQRGVKIFPPSELIYSWTQCSFSQLRVVIIGQDPYHNDQQAMGLCFSVPRGVAIPPSLLNIYKELASDVGITPPRHGDLTSWSKRGVLLLNTALTVRAHEPASHSGRGWEQFTDAVIKAVNKERKNVVFILWGNHAQKKAPMIDRKKHLVLTGVHPSPLSASRGFFGCRHFSKTNEYLESSGLEPIDWQLPQ